MDIRRPSRRDEAVEQPHPSKKVTTLVKQMEESEVLKTRGFFESGYNAMAWNLCVSKFPLFFVRNVMGAT